MDEKKYQELKRKYKEAEDPKERIDYYIKVTREIREDKPETALKMADKIIKDSQDIQYQLGVGEGLNHKGACYGILGEYEDGLNQLSQAYDMAKKINNPNLEAKVLNNLGQIYRNLGDLAHALRNFEAALDINETKGNTIYQTLNLTNISNLYYDLEDYDTALEYALKCLPIFEQTEDPIRLYAIYSTLGDIYFKKEDFDKALIYFTKNLELSQEGTVNRALASSGVGKVYFKTGKYKEALSYLERTLTHARKFNNPEVEIIAEFYLAKIFYEQKNFDKAIDFAEHACQLALDVMRKRDLISIHELLSILYEKVDDIPNAFIHLKEFESLREEVFQQKTLNKLRNLQLKTQMEVANKEKEVAERTANLKQQFLANMSHEIRTPMNAIVGITRLLLENEPKQSQIKYLKAINQSSDNLLVIINDILDFSKLEAGRIQIEQIDFSLRGLMQSMEEIMALKANQKQLEFAVNVDKDIPDRLVGDPTRLNQILVNLVSNAIKFTKKGHVRVTCSKKPMSDSGKIQLQFAVADTGIGISEAYVEKIFESFTQAGTDTARKYGGTGLGLSISRQLVTLMKGDIKVDSTLGVGTTFTVNIPIAVAKEQVAKEKKTTAVDALKERLNNLNILLVEDNEFNQLVAVDTLESLLKHVKVAKAENGQEAITAIGKQDFDVVLMDIQMPVMNGVEATRYIRSKMPPDKKNVPIIAMTANVLHDDVKKYMDEGMNGYVSKPFSTDELLVKIDTVLKNKKPVEKKQPPTNKTETLNFKLPGTITNRHFLEQFTKHNREKINKYITMFLSNCPRLLRQVDEALAKENFEDLRVAAHSMKPQLSYMGVSEEVSNILLIEQSAGSGTHRDRLPLWVNHLHQVCNKAYDELNAYLKS